MASSQSASFPDTSATTLTTSRDGRTARAASSIEEVSKSAEHTSLKVVIPSTEKSPMTRSNVNHRPGHEAQHRSSAASLVVPQPPAVGSPAASISPRLRSVSSRTLRSVPPGAPLSDAPDEAPDFWLSPSPREMSGLPDESRSLRRSITEIRRTPLGASPRTPRGESARDAAYGFGSGAVFRQAATGEAGGSGCGDGSDPWAALRAHCMAAYGSKLGSSDDGDHGDRDDGMGNEVYGEGGCGGAGRMLLMRHPSLLRRKLAPSLEDPSQMTAAGPASAAAAPCRSGTGRRHSPGGAAVSVDGPDDSRSARGPFSSIACAKAETAAVRQPCTAATHPTAHASLPYTERRPPCASSPQLTDELYGHYWARQTQPAAAAAAAGKSPMPGRSSIGGTVLDGTYGSPGGAGSPAATGLTGATPPPGVAVRNTAGGSPTVSMQGLLRRQPGPRGRSGSGAAAAAATMSPNPVRSGSSSTVGEGPSAFEQETAVLHSAAVAVLAALADSDSVEGNGSSSGGGGSGVVGSGGGGERRISESSGPVVTATASILTTATMLTDPVRMRRLSADGLSRHASKYGGVAAAATQVAPATPAAPAAAEAAKSVAGSAAKPSASPPPTPARRREETANAAATTAAGAAATGGASAGAGAASGSSPPGAGRAPIISALAFERAPWSHQAPHAAGTHPAVHPPPAGGARPQLVSPVPLRPVAPQTPQLQRRMVGPAAAGGPERAAAAAAATAVQSSGMQVPPHNATNAAAVAVPATSAATAVDKLRGYRSSKTLSSALGPPPAASGSPTQHPGPGASPAPVALAAAAAAGAANPTAVTGLSPPRPKLGHFTSARTLRTTAASSFLERLSNSSNLVGPSLGRTACRRTIGGGGDFGSELGGGGGNARRSFRRREGSVSLDGSGCDGAADEGGGPMFGGDQLTPAIVKEAVDGAAADAARQALGGASAAAAAGLYGRRSYKQLLPHGPNGLPLAWSAIKEDGREGRGDGGAGKEVGLEDADEDEHEDEDDDGFNLARMGGRIDLHQTC